MTIFFLWIKVQICSSLFAWKCNYSQVLFFLFEGKILVTADLFPFNWNHHSNFNPRFTDHLNKGKDVLTNLHSVYPSLTHLSVSLHSCLCLSIKPLLIYLSPLYSFQTFTHISVYLSSLHSSFCPRLHSSVYSPSFLYIYLYPSNLYSFFYPPSLYSFVYPISLHFMSIWHSLTCLFAQS